MQRLCATSQWRPGTRRPGENARPRGVHAAGRRPRPGSSHGCNARKPDGEKRLLDGFPAPSTAQPGACLIVTNFLNLRPMSSWLPYVIVQMENIPAPQKFHRTLLIRMSTLLSVTGCPVGLTLTRGRPGTWHPGLGQCGSLGGMSLWEEMTTHVRRDHRSRTPGQRWPSVPQGPRPLEEPACPHLTSHSLPPGRGSVKICGWSTPSLGCSLTAAELTHTLRTSKPFWGLLKVYAFISNIKLKCPFF